VAALQDNAISKIVADFFIKSSDFNGISGAQLEAAVPIASEQATDVLARLIEMGSVTVAFGTHQINPHILRLAPLPLDEQIRLLRSESSSTFCVYPTPRVLKKRRAWRQFDGKPFTRRLALGEPQLTPVYFELGVLERYYRDPRYELRFFDYGGQIVIGGEAYESSETRERDKIFLDSFGIAYDGHRNRVVVAYLRYLSSLTSEHQYLWLAHVIPETCVMNSDYERATIYGGWPEYHSAYQALIVEITEINKLASLIGKPPLFRTEFDSNSRPTGLSPMLRPTMRNLQEFVHLLDKMISENINREFFRGDVDLEKEITRSVDKVQVQQIGTLTLLRDWLRRLYRTADGQDISDEIVKALKRVRDIRQRPAHAIQADQYDQSLPGQQDQIVGDVVRSLTQLRVILWSHPKARENYAPPEWLDSDKIVFY
jgi:hypothetical protein